MDVVNNVVYEEADEESGTDSEPHDLPVPVWTMTNHVLYVFFKSETSEYVVSKYTRGTRVVRKYKEKANLSMCNKCVIIMS